MSRMSNSEQLDWIARDQSAVATSELHSENFVRLRIDLINAEPLNNPIARTRVAYRNIVLVPIRWMRSQAPRLRSDDLVPARTADGDRVRSATVDKHSSHVA